MFYDNIMFVHKKEKNLQIYPLLIKQDVGDKEVCSFLNQDLIRNVCLVFLLRKSNKL